MATSTILAIFLLVLLLALPPAWSGLITLILVMVIIAVF